MRIFRVGFRLFKILSMMYAVWRGSRMTRLVWLVSLVWRIIRRKPWSMVRPRVVFTFVNAKDGRIYHRRGWRKIQGNRAP